MSAPRDVVVLGVTGSIGTQAVDVIRAFPDSFNLKGMSGYSNVTIMTSIANEFKPDFIAVPTIDIKEQLLAGLTYTPTVFIGEEGLLALVDVPMAILLVAIVGTAALPPVVAAIPKVQHIAIANKSSCGCWHHCYGHGASIWHSLNPR